MHKQGPCLARAAVDGCKLHRVPNEAFPSAQEYLLQPNIIAVSNTLKHFPTRMVLGFGVSLLFGCLVTSCSKENLLDEPILDQEPIQVQLQGEWALTMQYGSIAGYSYSYPIDGSPRSLRFEPANLRDMVYEMTDSTEMRSPYAIQEVSYRNDTVFFTFSVLPDGDAGFFLSGRPMYLIDHRILQTALLCCDQVDYRFEKK